MASPLQLFCLKNKVPYNIFQKRYKDTSEHIVEVRVDGYLDSRDEIDEDSTRLTQSSVFLSRFRHSGSYMD